MDDILLICEHNEEYLKVFIDGVHMFHLTITFITKYSEDQVNFSDVNVKLIDEKRVLDFFVKPTDSH